MDFNNIVTKKSKGIGWAFLGGGILFFLLYWILLAGPVQAAAIDHLHTTGRRLFIATFVGALLIGFFAGIVFATLVYAGFTFLNLWWGKWQSDLAEVRWHDIFMLKTYRIWAVVGGAAFVLFTLIWRGEL